MKVNIHGKDIELKNTIKSLLLYENIVEETFAPKNLQSVITYFYCVIIASSKDYSIQFDDVVEYIDENPDTLEDFSKWLVDVNTTTDKIKKK